MDKLPRRKNNRLHDYDYSQAGYYFVTICTKDRQELLSKIVGASFHADPEDIVGGGFHATPKNRTVWFPRWAGMETRPYTGLMVNLNRMLIGDITKSIKQKI